VTANALKPGAVLGKRYRLVRSLGEGAMGAVWEATHVFTQKRVALKVLKSDREEDRRRFQREVRAAAAVHHPNVIDVHDFVELPEGTLAMVMDLLEGETLGTVLEHQKSLSLEDLASVLLPVLSALEALHAVGIVHRDLKPHNIFVAKTSGGRQVKVLDFGVAKLTAAEGLAARTQALTGTGSMVGTPYYMAPEQVVSEKDLDGRADIWSLGVLMYECLTGVRPTEAENVGRVLKRILLAEFEPIATLRPDLPEEIAALVTRMLAGDRNKRPQTIADVSAVLTRYAGSGVPAFPSPPADASTKAAPRPAITASETAQGMSVATTPTRRNRTVALGVLVLVAGAGFFAVRGWGIVSTKDVTPRIAAAQDPPAEPSATLPAASPLESAPTEPASAPSGSASGAASALPIGSPPPKPVKQVVSSTSRPAAIRKPTTEDAGIAAPAVPISSTPSVPKGPGTLAASPKD
jgi:serine/threonine-protein kinase